MSYSFRIRFIRSSTDTIQSDEIELQVPVPGQSVPISLKNLTPNEPIKDAKQLALSGCGYSSHQEALEAGEKCLTALTIALARVRVGADFGQRAAKGGYTQHGLQWLEQQYGHRILDDAPGLMVFATDPSPRFASQNARMVRGTNAAAFQILLRETIAKAPVLSDKEKLAISLFNASFFRPTADSRFLLLVMAIEALIEPAQRSPESGAHVELSWSNLSVHEDRWKSLGWKP